MIYRNTYAKIDFEALHHNFNSVQKIIKNKKIIPVVKANAYGHGVIEVVRYLRKQNIDQYAVSLLEEALELREEFKNISILIMGVIYGEGFLISSQNDFIVTVSNFDQIKDLEKLNSKLKVHLKVDTGMNRLGFKSLEDIQKAMDLLEKNRFVEIDGIYTHFATADGDISYYNIQRNRFKEIVESLDYDFNMIHCSNSSSSIKYESDIDFTTHVRLGISLYGLTLDEETKFLRNTYSLCTHIAEIKELKKNEFLGYGITYRATENEIIGVLPIGYADGFIRKNQNGDVEIRGKRYKIIGRICMDQMYIKIDKNITKNDEVILFGGIVSIDEVAKRLDTINYEIICQITSRVPKVYK